MARAVRGGIDLDLAALYELTDGRKGVVQALGNSFGNLDGPPYVKLDADDRTGCERGRRDALRQPRPHRRHPAHPRLRLHLRGRSGLGSGQRRRHAVSRSAGQPIEIVLDETRPGARTCAIAMLQNTGGDLTVSREVRYIDGAQDKLDAAYELGPRLAARPQVAQRSQARLAAAGLSIAWA